MILALVVQLDDTKTALPNKLFENSLAKAYPVIHLCLSTSWMWTSVIESKSKEVDIRKISMVFCYV